MVLAILLLLFVLLILIRTPVAFAMGVSSVVVLLLFPLAPMIVIPSRMFASVDSFVLLAVPLFILAGSLMERGGIASRLVGLAQAIIGHVKGALGMIVVVAEMFFSGISGSSVADVSAISAMLLPAMKRAGYKPEYSVSIIAAASAMGMLIPPCNNMIILGAMINMSIAALFFAGFLPAFVLALLIMALLAYQARIYNLPAGQRSTCGQFARAAADALIPLGMPLIIFGGILGGVFSPTESAGVAVAYALLVGMFVYREIKLKDLLPICIETAVVTATVLVLVQLASTFSYLMAIEQLPKLLAGAITSVSSHPLFFLMISNLIFIILGSLLEGMPAMIIFVPILYPIAQQLGVDMLHWGILVITAVGYGLFLPPAGVGIVVGCSVGKVGIGQVTKPLAPFFAILLLGLVILTVFPFITTLLPVMMNMHTVKP